MNFAVDEVLAEIDRQAGQFGVNPLYAKALAVAENTADGKASSKSSWSGAATSPMGAQGIMQVMPATARGLQKAGFLPADWKYDPANLSSQVSAGLAAMKDVTQRSKNPDDVFELGAGYNGSPIVHKNYLSGGAIPAETSNYFTKIRRAMMDMGTTPATPAVRNSTSGGTSTGKTTRTSESAPLSMEMFTSQAFNLASPGGLLDQTADQVNATGAARNAAGTALLQAITAKATAAGQEAMASSAVESADAARRAMILTTMNLDPGANGNLMDRAATSIIETDEQLKLMRPDIDRRMAVGFFDNPLEWLVNQTRLPGMVQEYNNVAGVQNSAMQTYKDSAAIANTQQSISKGMDADLIMQKGVATAAAKSAEANEHLAKLQAEMAGANQRDALTLAQIATSKLDAAGKLVAATKVTVTESEASSEKQSAADVKAAAAKAELASLDGVNRLVKAAGGNELSLAQFKLMTKAHTDELITRATSGKFGKDFGESFSFQDSVGNLRNVSAKGGAGSVAWITATTAKAKTTVAEETAKQETLTGKKLTLKAKNELLPAELNNIQAVYEGQAATDMRTASDSNPYKLAYAVIAKQPELANNALAAFINKFGPAGTEPTFGTVDEKYLLARFAASVGDGTMPMPYATQAITEFYKFGMQKQAEVTSYPLYGLAVANTYKVVIPMTHLFSGAPTHSGPVDLADPGKVEKFLTMQVAMKAAQNQLAIRPYARDADGLPFPGTGGMPVMNTLGLTKKP